MAYLTPDHPDAFVDFPGVNLLPSETKWGRPDDPRTVLCPKCKGYGGWNLRLNSYPLHDKEDTPENRHKYVHFRAGCFDCDGWGWVTPEDAECLHQWDGGKNIGKCLHRHTCEKCGKSKVVDSSD